MENKTKSKTIFVRIIIAVTIIVIGFVIIKNIKEHQEKKNLYSSTISAIEDKNYDTAKKLAYDYWIIYDDKGLFTLVQILKFDSELDSLILKSELENYQLKSFKASPHNYRLAPLPHRHDVGCERPSAARTRRT